MTIPFLSFDAVNAAIKSEILKSFEDFVDSGWYVLGERVIQFEKEYTLFNEVSKCDGVSNGLDALHICLKVLGIGQGDEVIIPANTYIATALAVSYTGATPVFVEPNVITYNINVDRIEQSTTPRTKAVMPVHFYGQACEMEAIMLSAHKYNLCVIEDNAQSQGAAHNNKLTGSWGKLNGTSFYPGKNLGALGDPGAITTNDADLSYKAVVLRNYGSEKKNKNDIIGFNMRLDECQVTFLSVKLKRLAHWTKQRQEIASWYDSELSVVNDIILPQIAVGATHVYHLYAVSTTKRNALQEHLKDSNIGTLIHYPIPPYLQEAYSSPGFSKAAFPIAEELADTCLSSPIWPSMSRNQVKLVAQSIKVFFDVE